MEKKTTKMRNRIDLPDENGIVRCWCKTCEQEFDYPCVSMIATIHRDCGGRSLPVMACRPCIDASLIKEYGSVDTAFVEEMLAHERPTPWYEKL